VSLPDEYTNHLPPNERKICKFANIRKKPRNEEKSKFKVIRKIALLVEDRFYFLIRFGKSPFKTGFFLFMVIFILLYRIGYLILMTYLRKNVFFAKPQLN
jgi:hypothetical protein